MLQALISTPSATTGGKYISGTDLAERLGISGTTLNRRILRPMGLEGNTPKSVTCKADGVFGRDRREDGTDDPMRQASRTARQADRLAL